MSTPGDIFYVAKRHPERKRTLTCRWEGQLPSSAGSGIAPFPDPGYLFKIYSEIECTAPGPSVLSPAIMRAQAGINRNLGFYVEVTTGWGSSNSDDKRGAVSAPLIGDAANDSTYVCEWSVTDVVTYFALYFLNEGVAGANGDPTYGGPAVNDVNPRALGIMFFEVAEAGATVTATMTVTSGSSTATATATDVLSSDWIIPHYITTCTPFAQVSNNSGTKTATVTATVLRDWEETGPTPPLTFSEDGTTLTIDGNVIQVTVVGAYTGGPTSIWNGGAQFASEPDRRYEIHGALYAMSEPYPDSLTLAIAGKTVTNLTLSPTGSANLTQRTYSAAAIDTDLDIVPLGSRNEGSALKTYLTRASLEAAGEDINDWRTMIADRAYNAIDIAHAAELVLPTPTEDTPGQWSHTFTPLPGNFEGYRYLKLTAAVGAIDEEVTIVTDSDPSKTYKFVSTTAASEVYYIDLCDPEGSDSEISDSRYPIRNDGLPHEDSMTFGIGRIRSYTITGPTAMSITDARLVRRSASALLDTPVAFNDWELAQTQESYEADGSVGVVEIIQGSRGPVVTVDGKRAIIEMVSRRQLFTDAFGNQFWVYSGRHANNFIATLTSCPGFTATNTPYTPSDGWMALDGTEAANLIDGGDIYYAGWSGFALGGGVIWTGNSPVNKLGTTLSGSPTVIPFQPRYDEVLGYPAMGDVWGDGANTYTARTPIRVAKILRAVCDGIALGGSNDVNLYDGRMNKVSEDTPGLYGIYRMTNTPQGKGQQDHECEYKPYRLHFDGEWDPEQGLGTTGASHDRWNARRYHRAVYPGTTLLDFDTDDVKNNTVRYALLFADRITSYTNSKGDVVAGRHMRLRSNFQVGGDGHVATRNKWTARTNGGRLDLYRHLWFGRWMVHVAIIESSKVGTFDFTEMGDGLLGFYWRVDDPNGNGPGIPGDDHGKIYGKIVDKFGNPVVGKDADADIGTPFIAHNGPCDDVAVRVRATGINGKRTTVLSFVSGSALVTVTSTDGKNFS